MLSGAPFNAHKNNLNCPSYCSNQLAQLDIEIRFIIIIIISIKDEIKIGDPKEIVCLRCIFGGRKSAEIELLVYLDCMQWDDTSATGEGPKMTQGVLFNWNEIFSIQHLLH